MPERAGEPREALGERLPEEKGFLWSLCYRMTGSVADADDLVQETFARALTHPPADLEAPLRPWLVRVAVNLSRDALRRRKTRGYEGPWLPSPLETPEEPERSVPSGEARYSELESVSCAFLLALEALSPLQRAVLILRDVFDYTGAEVAEVLGISEGNVRVTHHRARKAMEAYDAARLPITSALQAKTRAALEAFLMAITQRDVAAAEALLAEGVRAVNDGGGEFLAARVPVVGKDKVARFLVGLTAKGAMPDRFGVRILNGLPTIIMEWDAPPPRQAPRLTLRVELGADGKIVQVDSVLATRKLTALPKVG